MKNFENYKINNSENDTNGLVALARIIIPSAYGGSKLIFKIFASQMLLQTKYLAAISHTVYLSFLN